MKTLKFFAFVAAALVSFAACSTKEDGKDVDKTALTALVEEAQSLLSAATTEDYPQESIDLFTRTLATISGSVAGATTQTAVDNLTANLQKAITDFKDSAYGAIPSTTLTMELAFETQQAKTTGVNAWDVTYCDGPAVVFGDNAGKCTLVAGRNGKGKALHVENGAYAQITNYNSEALLGNAISVSCWVKTDKTYPHNYIISNNSWHCWKMQIQDGAKVFWTYHATSGISDMDNESDNSVPAGEWKHVVVSCDAAEGVVDIYVNGELTKHWTEKPKGVLVNDQENQYLLIGAADLASDETTTAPSDWACFYGAIDELKVYSTTLTEGQVAKLYKNEK